MKSTCTNQIYTIMSFFVRKNKGKRSPDTRGLSDSHHPQPYHVTSPPTSSSSSLVPVSVPVPVTSHILSPPVSLVATPSSPPVAVPYGPPPQAQNNGPSEVNFFAGGNENEDGEQEVDNIEIGNSSNGVVSPIFANNGGKYDIKVGNNKNKGGKQTIRPVKFGNAE